MALRSRLARLSAAGLTPARPSPSPPAPPAPAPPAPEPAASASVLEDLRRRMDGILARASKERPRPKPRVDAPDLPFAVEQTAHGDLHVRTLHLSGAHRVGRAPACAARSARADLLALLALDPNLAARDPRRALYLDTETTGLGAGAGTVAFLVGLAWLDASEGLVVEQLLVRQLGDEAPVLARVRERMAQASMLVTFNGKSFDMPVLRARFVMAREAPPPEPPHLDLLHVGRRLHKGRGVGATLTAIERDVLGFCREDDVPSGEVSACYLHFLRTGDTRALLGVVDHNAWDVVTMAALVGLYGEPLEGSELAGCDLAGAARTLSRAGSSDLALRFADEALARGGGHDALRARAETQKARGDKGRALADFEALVASVDDPKARLELAKLYEHHAKDAARALELVLAGTSEREEPRARRAARLERKIEKSRAEGDRKATRKLC